jgi:hypothetical protein
MGKHAFLAFALIAVAVVAPALSADSAAAPPKRLMDYVREARAARIAGNHQAWRDAAAKALAFVPEHSDILISTARAEAALGDEDAALKHLDNAIRRGAGLDLSLLPEFGKLSQRLEFVTLAQHARSNASPIGKAVLFARLRRDTQSEGIAYDPVSQRLFAGSVQGEIFAIDSTGAVSTFVPPGSGLREVYGLKVDAERRLLWAATSVFPDLVPNGAPKQDLGVSGVFAFSLTDGRQVTERWLKDRSVPHGFNDIALATNGTIYITDSPTGSVYRLRPGAAKLELFVRDTRFSFPNGIAMWPDQRRLIVASVEGLSVIDVRTRHVRRLGVPANAGVNSIDGLLVENGSLIGVQSSPYLARTVRITLDPGLTAVTAVTVLNSFTPREYYQTTAAVGGNHVYLVGGTPAVDAAGRPLATEPQPHIVRFPLR